MDLLKNKNFAFSTLQSGILVGATSLTISAATGSRFPTTGYFMAVIWDKALASPGLDSSRELVKMTLTSGDTFSITRAQEGTTAKAWDATDNIACVITAGKLDELEVAVQGNILSYAIATGTNAYSAVMSPIVTSYVHGASYTIKFTNASTGASTLALNSLTAKKLYVYYDGAYSVAGSGNITAGLFATVYYDSTLDGGAGGFILDNARVPINADTADIADVAVLANTLASGAALANIGSGGLTLNYIESIIAGNVLGRSSGTGAPVSTPLLTLISTLLGLSRGDILVQGVSGLSKITPGTSGNVLTSAGSGADPYYAETVSLEKTVEYKTGTFTVRDTDIGKVFSCSGTWTLNLDASATLVNGFFCNIKNTGTGIITVNPYGSETIDDELYRLIYPNQAIDIVSNGSNILITAKYGLIDTPTAQSLTSQFTVTFDDIPAYAKKVNILVKNWSTNGTSIPLIKLYDTSAVEATYVGKTQSENAGVSNVFNPGIPLTYSAAAASTYVSILTLCKMYDSVWSVLGDTYSSALAHAHAIGTAELSDTLQTLLITTESGVGVFDSGTFAITIE